jgi:hypothetical protein
MAFHVEEDSDSLEFIDSCGIRAVITLCKDLDGRGRVILRSPQGEVAKVLELIRADSFPNLQVIDEGPGQSRPSRSPDGDLDRHRAGSRASSTGSLPSDPSPLKSQEQ